jgi:hypothetical protein
MISRVAYGGWPNNVRLTNDRIELIATLDVGPRIIRFGFVGGENVFKEFPEQMGKTGESEWMIRGGHRLWHAPEAKPRTYALDNSPVSMQEIGPHSVSLTMTEQETSIQKTIEITMDPEKNEVHLLHRLVNTGPWDIALAPWALSVMAPGGMAIIPLPEKRPHTEVLTPAFPLVIWPYTDLADARYGWGTRYITFSQDNAKGPGKFGMALEEGWAGYLRNGVLFVKNFDYFPSEEYPDMGCNFETYSNQEFLEVESLGYLSVLESAGGCIEHVETWRLFADVPAVATEEAIDRQILPLLG